MRLWLLSPAASESRSGRPYPDTPPCWLTLQRSDHRIPGDRDQPVFRAVLFDMADAREGEVEADHGGLLGRRHVVEFVAGFLRQFAIDVVGDMPIRIAQEELRNVGDV